MELPSCWKKKLDKKFFTMHTAITSNESILGAGWKTIFGKTTTGPENLLFNKVKIQWATIFKSKPFKSLSFSGTWLKCRANEVCDEIEELFKTEQYLKN